MLLQVSRGNKNHHKHFQRSRFMRVRPMTSRAASLLGTASLMYKSPVRSLASPRPPIDSDGSATRIVLHSTIQRRCVLQLCFVLIMHWRPRGTAGDKWCTAVPAQQSQQIGLAGPKCGLRRSHIVFESCQQENRLEPQSTLTCPAPLFKLGSLLLQEDESAFSDFSTVIVTFSWYHEFFPQRISTANETPLHIVVLTCVCCKFIPSPSLCDRAEELHPRGCKCTCHGLQERHNSVRGEGSRL